MSRHARYWREHRYIDLWHLVRQQARGRLAAHPQHAKVVEVVEDLASLGLVTNLRLDVEHRLGVCSDAKARSAQLVDHRNELGACNLVDLIEMATHSRQLQLPVAVWVEACLVELAAGRNEIGQHGITHGRRNHGVRQGIQAGIHDAALAEHRHPVEDRPLVVRVEVVRADELANCARGELFEEWPQAGNDLFVERTLVAEGVQNFV